MFDIIANLREETSKITGIVSTNTKDDLKIIASAPEEGGERRDSVTKRNIKQDIVNFV
jgi:hypothetical protein